MRRLLVKQDWWLLCDQLSFEQLLRIQLLTVRLLRARLQYVNTLAGRRRRLLEPVLWRHVETRFTRCCCRRRWLWSRLWRPAVRRRLSARPRVTARLARRR